EDVPTQAVAVPVEDVPTQAVEGPVEDVPTQAVNVPVEDVPTQAVSVPVEDQRAVQGKAAERLPANLYLSVPATEAEAQEKLAEGWHVESRGSSNSGNSAVAPGWPDGAPFVSAASPQSINVPGIIAQEKGMAASAPPVRRSRLRWPVVVAVVLLIVLIGGVGAAIMLSQQSGGDAIIQPEVSFSDTQLGMSLLYPNGWIKQVEADKSTVHFYASNHVGEVDVVVAARGGDVKQSLQQQAAKMGMSGTKAGAPLNFAGASWQQLQGSMQQSGANYTGTILATLHGSQLYMIVQQAPQNDNADWEKEFFAPLRESFKFL
ncbi:MAG: hypothetical protein JO011_21015, partial [Ktedonobacteraceae bacterium]|nr:hypothetical protein [Ktedonobacteraceae bacterium]